MRVGKFGDQASDGPWIDAAVPAVVKPGGRAALQPSPGYPPPLEFFEPSTDDLKSQMLRHLRVIIKRRWLISGVVGITLALGFLSTMLMTPIYSASATLQIDRQAPKVVDDGSEDRGSPYDPEFYQTQYELLKSRSLAERVVASLNLTENALLFGTREPGWLGKIWRGFFGAREAVTPDLQTRTRIATNFVKGGLVVDATRLSRIVRLSFSSPSPELSQQVVNAVAEGFIASSLDRRFDASSYARTFLEEHLQQLKLKLEESDRNLVEYAQNQQIVNLDDKQTLVGADLAAVNAKLTTVRAERTRNEELWHQAELSEGLGLPQILDSVIIQKLRDSRAQLEADYQQRRSLLKPAYPEMVNLQARIGEIDAQIKAEVDNVKNSIRAQYEASLNEEHALAAQLETLKTGSLDLASRSIKYNILQREADTNRTLYDGLLQRYKEIGVAGGVGTNNVSIVDRAQVPRARSSPILSRNLAIALVLGLLGGVMCAYGLEFIDDTFKSPDDVESKLGLPVLGVIPKSSRGVGIAEQLADPRSAVSEAYRSLCTALQFTSETGVPKTLLISSARPNEGKSTTALTLAKNFAQLGGRVLIIDADLRDPTLHKDLSLPNGAGLSNYLAGGARPPELLQPTGFQNLTALTSGPPPPNPAQLLAGPKMASLLSIGSEVYDLIIVDGPPVLGLADSPLLAHITAGTLLVTAAGETRQSIVKQALKRLQFARADILGVLLNKLDARHADYGYGSGYGYGDDYYAYGGQDQITHAKEAEAA